MIAIGEAVRPSLARFTAGMTLVAGVVFSLTIGAGATSVSPTGSVSESTVPPTTRVAQAIPKQDRSADLGSQWSSSADVATTVVGDNQGLSVMVARAASGYSWSTIAKLSVKGMSTDRWIGNYCVTGDGKTAVVVYGTRTMINRSEQMDAGGWAATVDLATGAVTDLGRGFTLAYFNPSCGDGQLVALTAFASSVTRIAVVNTGNVSAARTLSASGQWTSAVPVSDHSIAAAGGSGISLIDSSGVRQVEKVAGVPFDLTVLSGNRVGYVVNKSDASQVRAISLAGAGPSTVLAGGAPLTVGLARTRAGAPVVVGSAATTIAAGSDTTKVDARPGSTISTEGQLAVESAAVDLDGATDAPLGNIAIDAVAVQTGKRLHFAFSRQSARLTPADLVGTFTSAPKRNAMGSPTDPVEAEASCAVPRNDPTRQVYQPKPRQVEWAVDMAIQGHLTTTSANVKTNLGVPASYSPQAMFPARSLTGGSTIPAQVVLGVIAQESNMWQADRYTSPGGYGNPLVGNYYGASSSNPWWSVNFAGADCGYGLGQITDGMRKATAQLPGAAPSLPTDQQRAIALDYSANVAKTVQMLGDKWNELAGNGIVLNGGGSEPLENWFFAVWAYNSGFHANTGGPWGVGWSNNPINPLYDQNRRPFLETNPADAATPQRWPYPEKVMGFATWSLNLPETVTTNSSTHPTGYAYTSVAGFRLPWWTTDANRTLEKPPITQFCGLSQNACDPNQLASPCTRADSQCWWHTSTRWKDCDTAGSCGHGFIRFPYPDYAAPQADGISLPGRCDRGGLPAGALVVDDVSASTPPMRSGCTQQASGGTFSFAFGGVDSNGSYSSKVDLHQQGAGFNDHFWWGHDWADQKLRITGTWSLGSSLNQWTRVLVHIPSFAAWDPQAKYTINYGSGSQIRAINQHRFANEWVSLGVFPVSGVPSVSLSNAPLSNVTSDYKADGYYDIAWDAVAFQPLTAKPKDFVVSLGDSYSSGEGAVSSTSAGTEYSSESDHDGQAPALRGACHRSSLAWSRKAVLPSSSSPVGVREATLDSNLDYHMSACSGAVSANILSGADNVGQGGELPQLTQGYLDSNTTLVTISIGGNDMRFAPVLQQCIVSPSVCQDSTLAGDSQSLSAAEQDLLQNQLGQRASAVLAAIKVKAPNAKIILMGYPKLFADRGFCITGIGDAEYPWINQLSDQVRDKLSSTAAAAASMGTAVKFVDPQPSFSGRTVCSETHAIQRLTSDMTPGDKAMFEIPVAGGANIPIGISQQAMHPNPDGTDLYAQAMNAALPGFYN